MNTTHEQLMHMYWHEQMSLKDIAKHFNVSIPAIRYWMKRLDVPRRSNSDAQMLSRGTDALTKEMLEYLYHTEGLNQKEIGERYGLTQGAVKDRMKRSGIKTRGKARNGATNGMYGRTHTPEAREKIRLANQRQFSTEEARTKHALLTTKQIADGKTGKAYNKLELAFAAMLQSLGINYEQQHRLGRFVYDFYLPDRNALIEVHGTFWHADPRFYSPNDLSAIQQRNVANDLKKAERAHQDGYELLVFWEHDIHNSACTVMEILC